MTRIHPTTRRRDGKSIFGFLLVGIGLFILLDLFDIFDYDLAFTFGGPLLLIALGLFIGIRNNFKRNVWWILIAIGAVNLIPVFHIGHVTSSKLAVPVMLVIGGLIIALRSKTYKETEQTRLEMVTNGESQLSIENTMGGRKEIVTSKEFRGGQIRTTFGGTEVNLMQADGTVQPIVLDIQVSFGSVELIVPSYWEVINEIRPSMGSVEDHRLIRTPDANAERRTLVLRGACSFGSIEVKSY